MLSVFNQICPAYMTCDVILFRNYNICQQYVTNAWFAVILFVLTVAYSANYR